MLVESSPYDISKATAGTSKDNIALVVESDGTVAELDV